MVSEIYFYKQKAFTLIELLVVIAIIGLLATIVVINVNNARNKAADGRRVSDMKQIRTALEFYYDANGKYPGPTSSYGENSGGGCGGWDISREDLDGDGKPFIEPLIDGNFISAVPVDPSEAGTGCGNYAYYRYSAGSYGCDVARGDYYVLGIRDLKATSGTHPLSPGWRCPTRNWQGEFEWVTGAFEK